MKCGAKRSLTYVFFKLFRCEAYRKILGLLKKRDNRSRKLIFVGYRLWDTEKDNVSQETLKVKKKLKSE